MGNGRVLSAVAYRSVAHTPRLDNVAIRPPVVDLCLQLTEAQEVEVVSKDGDSRTVRETDFSSDFAEGRINWAGCPNHGVMRPGECLQYVVENGQWVARTEDGPVVDRTQ